MPCVGQVTVGSPQEIRIYQYIDQEILMGQIHGTLETDTELCTTADAAGLYVLVVSVDYSPSSKNKINSFRCTNIISYNRDSDID